MAPALLLALLLAPPRLARAGGIQMPDHGASALGRGAAFTAKADDPMALHYNVAGLARQRGTHLLVNANIQIHSFSFTRLGEYPDENNDETPWGGQAFPTVYSNGGPFPLPALIVTSDFQYFERLTFAFGILPPAVNGAHSFATGLPKGSLDKPVPAPNRYDAGGESSTTILFPTLGAGYRVLPWLDVGLTAVAAVASFNQTAISYSDPGGGCKSVEDYRCDARTLFAAKGNAFTGALGIMARPKPSWQFGAQLRFPLSILAVGTVSPNAPLSLSGTAKEAIENTVPAQLEFKLPAELRLGARYIKMEGTFENWDVEANITYETWSSLNPGPTVFIPGLGRVKGADGKTTPLYPNVTSNSNLNLVNTFSLRTGGAYNFDEYGGTISLRGGMFYDSPGTESKDTKLGFNTLAKVAGTFGASYKRGAFTIDFAYAAIASVKRIVTDGESRPGNGAKGGKPEKGGDSTELLPVTNNGEYKGFTHVIGLGVQIAFDSFLGERSFHYGDPTIEDVKPLEPKAEKPEKAKDEPDEDSSSSSDSDDSSSKKKKKKDD